MSGSSSTTDILTSASTSLPRRAVVPRLEQIPQLYSSLSNWILPTYSKIHFSHGNGSIVYYRCGIKTPRHAIRNETNVLIASHSEGRWRRNDGGKSFPATLLEYSQEARAYVQIPSRSRTNKHESRRCVSTLRNSSCAYIRNQMYRSR